MSFFDVLGSIFEKWPMTDLTNVIVSMCLVSYNFCMIPHVLTVTFGLNLSGAWGGYRAFGLCLVMKINRAQLPPVLSMYVGENTDLHAWDNFNDKSRRPAPEIRR